MCALNMLIIQTVSNVFCTDPWEKRGQKVKKRDADIAQIRRQSCKIRGFFFCTLIYIKICIKILVLCLFASRAKKHTGIFMKFNLF